MFKSNFFYKRNFLPISIIYNQEEEEINFVYRESIVIILLHLLLSHYITLKT